MMVCRAESKLWGWASDHAERVAVAYVVRAVLWRFWFRRDFGLRGVLMS
jgi:hypothetical protein